jgi:hypothetical protein
VGGESDLTVLLRGMKPDLHAEQYGFGQLRPGADLPAGLVPFALIAEEEGLTVIAPAAALARHSVPHEAGWARISLRIQSSLSAVGLTARIATGLAEQGISANVVAGLRHDHFFVQWQRRDEAMAILARLGDTA